MRIQIWSKFVLEPPRVRQEGEMIMRISPRSCPIRRKVPRLAHASNPPRATPRLHRIYSLPRTSSLPHIATGGIDTGELDDGGWRKGKVRWTARPDPLHLVVEGRGCGAAGHPLHLGAEEM
jgi:hypothetical protein